MKRLLLSGPAVEPVLVAEVKAHLRLDTGEEDALVGAMIVAARVAAEAEIRQVLIAQAWRVTLDPWPGGSRVELPIAPALRIDAVRSFDAAGAATLLPADAYVLDGQAFVLRAATPGLGFPLAAARFEIDLTAGFGASGADVPAPIRQAILMLVTHWYEHRSAVILGDNAAAAPHGFRALLAPYRRTRLC